jgi:hypothetical protein
MDIITRKEALEKGLHLYFTGKPCKRGHICERTAKGGCVDCNKIKELARQSKEKFLGIKRSSEWSKANPVKNRKKSNRWIKNNPEKVSHMKRRGNGLPDPERPYPVDGKCECCNLEEPIRIKRTGKIRSLSLDHCHKTGKFRGWLCYKCNSIAGKSNEEIDRLSSLVAYLKSFYGEN